MNNNEQQNQNLNQNKDTSNFDQPKKSFDDQKNLGANKFDQDFEKDTDVESDVNVGSNFDPSAKGAQRTNPSQPNAQP